MRQQLVEDFGAKYPWLSGGILSTEQALLGTTELSDAGATALTATGRVIIEVPEGWSSMELRFTAVGTADLDDVLQLYAQAYAEDSNGNGAVDHYRHFAQLTIILGTQVYSTTQEFIDDITPANEAWITAADEVSPANNTFGSYVFNLHGSQKILVIASDLDNTSIEVHYRRL